MKERGRPLVSGIMGLLAVIGCATVLPYLHTCVPSAAASLAVGGADDSETSDSPHGCSACALASTVRASPATDAGPVAPPPEGALIADGLTPPLLAAGPDVSADPRAPPFLP